MGESPFDFVVDGNNTAAILQELVGMTESYKKLDARGRRLLEKLDPGTQVELLMRLDSDADPDQLQTLRQIGCQIGAGAGNVMTARIAVSKLPELAELPFISSLQLSREIFDEDD